MQFRCCLVALTGLLFPLLASGQSADDRYVQIYSLIEEADRLNNSAQGATAMNRYLEAQSALVELQRAFPDWNPKIVRYRLDYISTKLEPLSQKAQQVRAPAAGSSQNNGNSSAPTPTNQLKGMEQEIERLTARNALLEGKLREALSVQPAAIDPRELAKAEAKIKELQKERDLLAVSLEQSNLKARNPGESGTSKSAGQSSDLAKELETARARLQVLEAKQVPYTPEELALFKQPPPKVAPVQTNAPVATPATAAKKKSNQVPPGAGPIVAEAMRAIDTGRFQEAEKKYREVLRQDENNVYILANLAAVQLDQEKVEDAETTLKKAVAIDPEDAPSLYLLGSLKLRQQKYDEALEALSLSAKIDPDKAQTQYFLGKALIQKGNRAPAETALRRAIQLKPGSPDAHYLLAVLYTQEANYKELAAYHYNKAIKGGAPRNLELEKWMEKPAPAAKK